jgi:hypothetical protein
MSAREIILIASFAVMLICGIAAYLDERDWRK